MPAIGKATAGMLVSSGVVSSFLLGGVAAGLNDPPWHVTVTAHLTPFLVFAFVAYRMDGLKLMLIVNALSALIMGLLMTSSMALAINSYSPGYLAEPHVAIATAYGFVLTLAMVTLFPFSFAAWVLARPPETSERVAHSSALP